MFFIGINVGIVLALGILSKFKGARFKFLCRWFVYLVEHGGELNGINKG